MALSLLVGASMEQSIKKQRSQKDTSKQLGAVEKEGL